MKAVSRVPKWRPDALPKLMETQKGPKALNYYFLLNAAVLRVNGFF
jgi:hypothetical protein